MLARISNAMWDILLENKDEASSLAGSILTTKSVKMQTKYIGTRRTLIILRGVSMDIDKYHLADLFLPGMDKLGM